MEVYETAKDKNNISQGIGKRVYSLKRCTFQEDQLVTEVPWSWERFQRVLPTKGIDISLGKDDGNFH